MIDIIKIELKKMKKKKECYLMFSMVFIPILYSIGLFMNSSSIIYVGENKVNALLFSSEMFNFVYMCFIYFIIISVSSIKTLKGEIEDKSIQLYVQRINNRKKIYLSKNIAYAIFSIINTTIFILISVFCFYLFLIRRSDIATAILWEKSQILYCVINIISILVCFLFTINISFSISTYTKSFIAMVIFLFVWLSFLYLKEFAYVKYVIPIYYVENIINKKVGECDWISFGILILLVTFYSLLSIIIGYKKFEKSDLG